MTNNLEKIKQLIAVGEKAEPSDWAYYHNGTCYQIDGSFDAVFTNQFCYSNTAQDNCEFVIQSANTRQSLADFVAEYERMKKALEEIAGFANNVDTESYGDGFYLAVAQQALQETEQGE